MFIDLAIQGLRELEGKTLRDKRVKDLCIDAFLEDPESFKEVVAPYMAQHGFLTLKNFNPNDYNYALEYKEIPKFCACFSFPDIVNLNLELTDVDLGTLNEILSNSEMSELKSLNLSHCQLGDDGVKEISQNSKLSKLKMLRMNHCGLTDKSLYHLSESETLIGLKNLYLNNNPISDLSPLLGSPFTKNLWTLEIRYHKIINSSIKQFTKTHPLVIIYY